MKQEDFERRYRSEVEETRERTSLVQMGRKEKITFVRGFRDFHQQNLKAIGGGKVNNNKNIKKGVVTD